MDSSNSSSSNSSNSDVEKDEHDDFVDLDLDKLLCPGLINPPRLQEMRKGIRSGLFDKYETPQSNKFTFYFPKKALVEKYTSRCHTHFEKKSAESETTDKKKGVLFGYIIREKPLHIGDGRSTMRTSSNGDDDGAVGSRQSESDVVANDDFDIVENWFLPTRDRDDENDLLTFDLFAVNTIDTHLKKRKTASRLSSEIARKKKKNTNEKIETSPRHHVNMVSPYDIIYRKYSPHQCVSVGGGGGVEKRTMPSCSASHINQSPAPNYQASSFDPVFITEKICVVFDSTYGIRTDAISNSFDHDGRGSERLSTGGSPERDVIKNRLGVSYSESSARIGGLQGVIPCELHILSTKNVLMRSIPNSKKVFELV
jgi:hypothetical protein